MKTKTAVVEKKIDTVVQTSTKNLVLLLFFSLLFFFQKTVGAWFSDSHFKHVSNPVHLLKTFYDLFSFPYLYYFVRLHT